MPFLKAVFDKGRGRQHEDIKSLGGRRRHGGLQRVCTEGGGSGGLTSNLRLHNFNWERVSFKVAHLFLH